VVNVIIEPYEPIIYKAILAIETKYPHYFDGINRIILEQGDPGHFGKVHSDQPDTIFVSIQKVRGALSGRSEEEIVQQVAEILAHEMGHINAQFEGGEAPAEAEEASMREALSSSLQRNIRAAHYIRKLERDLWKQAGLEKAAYVSPTSSPSELANSIMRIVYHFAQKVDPDHQQNYFSNVSNRLHDVTPGEIASRPRNPGGGIGTTISLIKNILAGQPIETIGATLSLVNEQLGHL
jgi:hypothetical protein